MITINATGDTTIHTANKYCPEDILVKVPAGGSGGEKVETCTVQLVNPITSTGASITTAVYTALVDGAITAIYQSLYNPTEVILENVVCGSAMTINITGYSYIGTTTSGGIERVDGSYTLAYWKAPSEAGATAVITLYDND